MFGDGALTLKEFAMREPLPLAEIHDAILDFLRQSKDSVLFGAQAVNAYVETPRMTQDVDILSTNAAGTAEELRQHLADRFHVAVKVREVAGGHGFRVFQIRKGGNRHLADVRQVQQLPPSRLVNKVRVPTPEELIAQKVVAFSARRGQPKSGTDWRDLALLLLAFPKLKSETGAVLDRLKAHGARSDALEQWKLLAKSEIQFDDSEETWE